MDENIRNYSNSVLEITPITSEEELIVRKFINPQFFDVEAIINYLNNNSSIKKEIFLGFLTPSSKGRFYLSYLSAYQETRRDIFIKRIPIYFYDINLKNELMPTMTDFFDGYARYVTHETTFESFEGNENEYPPGFTFEPLYKIIDELSDEYSIQIEQVLNYIQQQRGSVGHYEIFRYWYHYFKLIKHNPTEEDVIFPRNILYSYNVELEKNGLKPIIHFPATWEDENEGVYVTYREDNELKIGGFFPIDDNGEPVLKWIGIWTENVKSLQYAVAKKNEFDNQIPIQLEYKMRPALKVSLKFELDSKTRIFLGYRRVIGYDDFLGEDKVREYWALEYCGPALMKLDCSKIVEKREELGYSIKQVAEATDINLRTYQRIENGEGSPDGLNLIKIMNYLDIDSYEDLIKKDIILDSGFEKFLSNKKISEFLDDENNDDDN